MRVAIRVDASPAIGIGHLQRCLALADALRRTGARVEFVTRDMEFDAASRVEAAGFAACRLPPGPDVDSDRDLRETAAALGSGDGPVHRIVVDHYRLDATWHRAASATFGAPVAVIDDLADRPLEGDLLIDHNLAADHRTKYRGSWPESAAILGGPRYALLGPAFRHARRWQAPAAGGDVRSIGIFLGGSDPGGRSAEALRACREEGGFRGPIEIVTTRANPQRRRLADAVRADGRADLLEDLPDLADFFARHDLQIGAGGGASWERCCIGAPSLLLVTAANQRAVVPHLVELGAAATVDEPATRAQLGEAIRSLLCDPARRQALAQRAAGLVDGRGAERVALRFQAARLALRPMTLADADLTHDWRNHPATRSMSNDPRPIDPADHRRWLVHSLARPDRQLWMARVGSIDVGVIRFDDNREQGEVEISLYLDPGLHGLGLGTAMLEVGLEARRQVMAPDARFAATVLGGNPASRRMFEGAGFRFEGERGHLAATSRPPR